MNKRAVKAASTASNSSMEIMTEATSPCTRKLTVTVPRNMIDQCFRTTVERLRQMTGTLAGFRTEKIPLSMIISQTGGQRKFKQACIEEILMKAYPEVMSGLKEPVVPGSDKVETDITDLEARYDPAKPLTFCVTYDTVPPVVWRTSYKDLEVTVKDNGNYATDLAAADNLILQLLKDKGHQRVVTGRGLAQGDTAIMDMQFTEVGSTLPLPGLSSDRARFDTDVDPFNLTQYLLGVQVGEERAFEITIPMDYPVELWQGMRCTVKVKVRELFAWTLPPLDDEFARKNYPGKFESADELKKGMVLTTAMERLQHLEEDIGQAVQKAVVGCVEISNLPESLVMEMASAQYRAQLLSMVSKGQATREEVEGLATEEMLMEWLDKRRAEMEDLCKFNIAADEIFATEQLTLDEADVQAEVSARCSQYKAQGDDFDEAAVRDEVVDAFKHVRVVEWLKDNVKRTITPFTS